MSPEYQHIAELLEDETRSFRSIGRELGVSDWLVRKIARELDGDLRPMKQQRSHAHEVTDDSSLAPWLVFGGMVFGVAFLVWIGARSAPPPESPGSSFGFYP